jgi:hypothetical protein
VDIRQAKVRCLLDIQMEMAKKLVLTWVIPLLGVGGSKSETEHIECGRHKQIGYRYETETPSQGVWIEKRRALKGEAGSQNLSTCSLLGFKCS